MQRLSARDPHSMWHAGNHALCSCFWHHSIICKPAWQAGLDARGLPDVPRALGLATNNCVNFTLKALCTCTTHSSSSMPSALPCTAHHTETQPPAQSQPSPAWQTPQAPRAPPHGRRCQRPGSRAPGGETANSASLWLAAALRRASFDTLKYTELPAACELSDSAPMPMFPAAKAGLSKLCRRTVNTRTPFSRITRRNSACACTGFATQLNVCVSCSVYEAAASTSATPGCKSHQSQHTDPPTEPANLPAATASQLKPHLLGCLQVDRFFVQRGAGVQTAHLRGSSGQRS